MRASSIRQLPEIPPPVTRESHPIRSPAGKEGRSLSDREEEKRLDGQRTSLYHTVLRCGIDIKPR